ncbi:hypothetical protein ACOMHN_057285 [Nucella lapillus]
MDGTEIEEIWNGVRTLGGCLDESHCYTLEVSFYSYTASTTGQATPYTEEAYMKLGRNLARTFLDYYKLCGYISSKPSSSMLPKPGATRSRPDRRDMRQTDRDGAYNSLSTERSTVESLQRPSQGSLEGPGGGQFGGSRFDRGPNREERVLRRGEMSMNGSSSFTEPGMPRPRRF